MNLKILFEDANLLVVDKEAWIDVEGVQKLLPEGYAPAHRLDKDTSGVLLVAKTPESLEFFRQQFKQRMVEKIYLCLAEGRIEQKQGEIETLLGRSPNDRRKQKVFLPGEPGTQGKREAVTKYKVAKRYAGYTFLEVKPKTGRKHQIRAHLSHLGHPVAGDKLYGFKNQKAPEGLKRQFLHAYSLCLTMPNGKKKEFTSPLPVELQKVLDDLA
ncbi:MAG: hypothetical protein A3D64_01485 [Candidatus Wildermuthbacteria bacterium RIFCSPHIGHO2_02_FULL_49_9]|uniref:Pseudouridine synthase RsuA/RluA-like domain-containing protein n=1 Tax=Candidatus Wildermuthbacteria bacterium RIFCSPHIGHO2_02_FULL_49_9 TaxID=1802456 RepID=A0A1G2REP5_9BACT|nr:MAG: hypothetical protein A3D64_01485 [Candidatus Wildermuthbacteria bacterium RIFCSPHIGHO2_02_FULL_49_9]